MIDYSVDGDGIATISWNVTNRPMNVMNEESISAFAAAVDKAIGDESVVGVIVTSSRREFVVGADLDQMRRAWKDAQSIYESGERFQGLFRRMETSEKPFVAAITGASETSSSAGMAIRLDQTLSVSRIRPSTGTR